MDIASLIGIIAGILFIFFGSLNAIQYDLMAWVGQFVNFPSILITVGGTGAATLINYPLPQVMSIVPILRNVFTTSTETPNEAIEILVSLAEKARREGLLSLEADVEMQENEFLKKGI